MIRKGLILVPTDFSELAAEALRRAVVIARAFPARIHLLHAFVPPAPAWGLEGDALLPPVDWTEELRQAAHKRLEAQKSSVEGVEITTELREAADAAEAITEAARELAADLIVIGRHGKKGALARLLLGSTTERVVREAPCSVLIAMPHGFFTDDRQSR